MAEPEKEPEKVKKQKYEVGEVATQTAPVIINNETEKSMTTEMALAEILNKLDKIHKGLE